jgi:gamma-glutamyl hydrolase
MPTYTPALLLLAVAVVVVALNDRPVIGILTIPTDYSEPVFRYELPASYVKWVEAAGGRVVPIPYDLEPVDFEALLLQLNGALLTGGDIDLHVADETGPDDVYTAAARRLYDHALLAAQTDELWPLWGTCMGFEVIGMIASNNNTVLSNMDAWDESLRLGITPQGLRSKMLTHGHDAEYVQLKLMTEPLTLNNHHQGILPSVFDDPVNFGNLATDFTVVALDADRAGLPFVSAYEHVTAPVLAVQFHPEKVFEWTPKEVIDHSEDAVVVSTALARTFLWYARQNSRVFASEADETDALIYNYCPRYTGASGSSFTQEYFF